MEDTRKYRVSFRRSGDHIFDSKDQAHQYYNQYTQKEKKGLEAEWGVGESDEVKMDKIALNNNGMEVDTEIFGSMPAQE